MQDANREGRGCSMLAEQKSLSVGDVKGRETSAGEESKKVDAINKFLVEKLGAQKYKIWFENSTRMSLSEGYLKIAVPNLFIASWIQNHFGSEIKQAARSVISGDVKLSVTIAPELTEKRASCSGVKPGEGHKSDMISRRGLVSGSRGSGRKKLKFNFDGFVVGNSNQLAYNAARAVADEPVSPFNPLFIHGGYGIGKTHLQQGICNEVRRKRPRTRWLYLSAEDFANRFILALKTRKLEAFRRRMRETDLLAIDDIHFLASKPSTQEEFLHTFNKIDLNGKQIVLVSDAHPKMIGQLSEKLVNRFVSGMVVKIKPPDFETRCRICRRFAKLKNKPIAQNVIKFIAERIRNNVRELEGALLKLIAFSALQNSKISVTMAQDVLAGHLERCDPIVYISDIESAAAAYFAISTADIHSQKKNKTITLARHVSMYLARKHTKMSSSEIGRFMGNKNHATVLLACKKVKSLLERNAQLNWNSPQGNRVIKVRTLLEQLEASAAT